MSSAKLCHPMTYKYDKYQENRDSNTSAMYKSNDLSSIIIRPNKKNTWV